MANHDYVIDNGSGSAVRADINNALQAIASVNSSASDPSTVVDKMLWHDTTANALKQRNSGSFTGLRLFDPRIINIGLLDANGNEAIGITATASAVNEITIANAATGNNPAISATGGDTNINLTLTPKGTGSVFVPAGTATNPSVSLSTDTNTGIYFPSADTMGFVEGGTGYQMGYRNVPSAGSDKTTNYTLQLSDRGKLVSIGASGGITVPNAVFSAGDIIYVYNNTASSFTITRGTSAVLYQSGINTDSATLTVATRTMGAIQYVSSSTAVFFSGSQGSTFYEVEYLIVAGGGGSGSGAGGGAGGYISAVTGETGCYCDGAGAGTGNNYVPTGKFLQVQTGVNYNVQVGAGGSSQCRGTISYLDTIIAIGGGAGSNSANINNQQYFGGSGGGGAPGASAISLNQFVARQGNKGSSITNVTPTGYSGGGAGDISNFNGTGGVGMSSSITGSAVTYATGGNSNTSSAGTANTGNGASQANNGGSGVIIIKYPSSLTLSTSSSHISSTNGTYTNNVSDYAEITCSGGHNLGVGEAVTCDFTSGTAVDGTYTVVEIVSSTVFRVNLVFGNTSGNVTITQSTLAVTTTTSGNSKISTFTAGFGTFSFS